MIAEKRKLFFSFSLAKIAVTVWFSNGPGSVTVPNYTTTTTTTTCNYLCVLGTNGRPTDNI